jgi:hypothetical protein
VGRLVGGLLTASKPKDAEKYSMRLVRNTQGVNLADKEYIYSAAKRNVYEEQMNELRRKVRDDKNYFYTWSKEYLSLSVDPFTVDQVRREDNKKSKERYTVPKGFENVIKKQVMVHDLKPGPEKIEEIAAIPYHELLTLVIHLTCSPILPPSLSLFTEAMVYLTLLHHR